MKIVNHKNDKINKSINHERKGKTKLNKLKFTKEDHLRVQGGDNLQIYGYPFLNTLIADKTT